MTTGHHSSHKTTAPENSKKTSPHTAIPATQDAELDLVLHRASASPHLLSQGDVLHLQRRIGNQAVMRLLQREEQPTDSAPGSGYPFSIPGGKNTIQRTPAPETVQREEEEAEQDGSEELTVQEEKEILQAKRLIQRQPDSTRRMIQRAWTGRRQLGKGGLNKLLGKPWVIRKKGNFLRTGGYHEHIFFEDGEIPADIGHMGKQGLGQDTGRENEYTHVRDGLDDARMRQAVVANSNRAEPDRYDLLHNNCQDFVHYVLKTYNDL